MSRGAPDQHQMSGPWLTWPVLFGILSLTAMAYLPVRKFDFINFDDSYLVQSNPLLLRPLSFEVLFSSFAGWIHPLTNFSYWLESSVFGIQPTAFHMANLIFHLLGVSALYFWILELTGSRLHASLLAMLFAWHPTHVEAVGWIAQQNSVLAAAFFWLSLYAHARAMKGKGHGFWIASWVFAFLSLMAKPFALGLPLVFLLVEWWKEPTPFRDLLRRRWLSLGLFGALVIVVAGANISSQWAIREGSSASLWSHFTRVPLQLAFYVEKTILPLHLKIIYGPQDLGLRGWPLLLLVIWAVSSAMAARVSLTFRRNFIFGFGFFLLMIVPTLKLIPFGDESPVSDRYLYVAQTGLLFPFVAAAGLKRKWLLGTVSIFAIFCFYLTILRLPDWRESSAMWQSLLRVQPDSKDAYENLGSFELGQQHLDEALKLLSRGKTETANNKANRAFILVRKGQMGEADQLFKQAEDLSPESPTILNMRGTYYLELGDLVRASEFFRRSLARPAVILSAQVRAEAQSNLGVLEFRRGDYKSCLDWQRQALKSSPTYLLARYNQALCHLRLKEFDQAERDYISVLKSQPGFAIAENDLGAIALGRGDRQAAVDHFKRALTLDPSLKEAADNLTFVLKTTTTEPKPGTQ